MNQNLILLGKFDSRFDFSSKHLSENENFRESTKMSILKFPWLKLTKKMIFSNKTEQNWIFWKQFYFKIWCVVKNAIEIWWVVKNLIKCLTSCKNEAFIDRLTRCRTSFQKLINTKKWLNLILFTNFASKRVSSQIVHLGIKISKTTQKS